MYFLENPHTYRKMTAELKYGIRILIMVHKLRKLDLRKNGQNIDLHYNACHIRYKNIKISIQSNLRKGNSEMQSYFKYF